MAGNDRPAGADRTVGCRRRSWSFPWETTAAASGSCASAGSRTRLRSGKTSGRCASCHCCLEPLMARMPDSSVGGAVTRAGRCHKRHIDDLSLAAMRAGTACTIPSLETLSRRQSVSRRARRLPASVTVRSRRHRIWHRPALPAVRSQAVIDANGLRPPYTVWPGQIAAAARRPGTYGARTEIRSIAIARIYGVPGQRIWPGPTGCGRPIRSMSASSLPSPRPTLGIGGDRE